VSEERDQRVSSPAGLPAAPRSAAGSEPEERQTRQLFGDAMNFSSRTLTPFSRFLLAAVGLPFVMSPAAAGPKAKSATPVRFQVATPTQKQTLEITPQ